MGLCLSAEVTALHVIDPWLKKFYNELYSQGRRRYLEYVDERLQADADRLRSEFTGMCQAEGVSASFRLRQGDPLDEILAELRQNAPDLLITGGKQLGAWGRFRSRNLPLQLQKKAGVPVSVVPLVDDRCV
jgi:nucleotide-binding universal stress UspA family protein